MRAYVVNVKVGGTAEVGMHFTTIYLGPEKTAID